MPNSVWQLEVFCHSSRKCYRKDSDSMTNRENASIDRLIEQGHDVLCADNFVPLAEELERTIAYFQTLLSRP
jgi:hypothetical protein